MMGMAEEIERSVEQTDIPEEEVKLDNSEATQDRNLISWYPIYTEKPNHVMIDLAFIPTSLYHRNVKQAYLTCIYINTRYAFVQPVDFLEDQLDALLEKYEKEKNENRYARDKGKKNKKVKEGEQKLEKGELKTKYQHKYGKLSKQF